MNWHKATEKPTLDRLVWILSRVAPEHGGGFLLREGIAEGWYDGKGGWCVSTGSAQLPDRDFITWMYADECDMLPEWLTDETKTD